MSGVAPAESELCEAGFQAELTQLQGGEDALELTSALKALGRQT